MSRVVFVETLRRNFTSVPFLAFTGFVVLVASISGALNTEASIWHTFGSLLVIGVGAQLIGPEFSAGTLQLILSKPVNRSVYLLSRFAGVLVAAWSALAVALLFDLGGRVLVFTGPSDWQAMLQSSGGEALHAVLTCALLALFGSLSRSYFNVAIYLVLNVVLSLVVGAMRAVTGGIGQSFSWLQHLLVAHPQIIQTIQSIHENIFPDVPRELDPRWATLVVSNAAIALYLACLLFRRREVPYGAD
jgi:ABC-type transport system involved in multi-copper enzyme maturation permease subunit